MSDTYVSDFIESYITAALWSSTDESDERGGAPLDDNYGPDDIDAVSRHQMGMECKRFIRENLKDLQAYGAAIDTHVPGYNCSVADLAGRDFWLTRNDRGVGFWDRDAGEAGERLTEAAHKAGGRDLYVGDDGRVYCTP